MKVLECRQRAAAHGNMGELHRVATNEEAKKYRVAEPVGTLKKLSPETTPDGVRPSSFA
jgi:hypothetical protein